MINKVSLKIILKIHDIAGPSRTKIPALWKLAECSVKTQGISQWTVRSQSDTTSCQALAIQGFEACVGYLK